MKYLMILEKIKAALLGLEEGHRLYMLRFLRLGLVT